MDAEGVGSLENDEIDKVSEQHADEEHEPSVDKGDKTAAMELKERLLENQLQIDPSTSHVQCN